jgi:hypothetical protein
MRLGRDFRGMGRQIKSMKKIHVPKIQYVQVSGSQSQVREKSLSLGGEGYLGNFTSLDKILNSSVGIIDRDSNYGY